MSLPKSETDWLAQRGLAHTVTEEASMTCVVFPGFVLPEGFNQRSSDLLIRLNAGFPDVPPDMWWFSPAVLRADGKPIPNTEHFENHLGRRWQRWSRHFNTGQWRAGTDSLESFLALIRSELERSVPELV